MQIHLIHIFRFLVLFFLIPVSLAGQKTDTLYLKNGDRLTGEIKKYESGYLFYKSDGMGTLKIEYDRIATFYSKAYYNIRMDNGFRYYGSFDTSRQVSNVYIKITNDEILTPLESVVEIYPLGRAFLTRLSGNFDVGLNYAKSTGITQFNLAGNFTYKTEKYLSELNGSSIVTDQKDKDIKRSNEANYSLSRFLKHRWSAVALAGVSQNDELGIDLRLQSGLGISNHLIFTNLHRLLVASGILINNEWTSDSITQQNYEGLFAIKYDIFKFHSPKVSLSTFLYAFPSLTVKDRIRTDFEINGKIDIISDLYFSVRFYSKYDSKPSGLSNSNHDYGFTTGIGYSFN